MPKFYSEADKADRVSRINEMIAKGLSCPEACKEVGISRTSYGRWKTETRSYQEQMELDGTAQLNREIQRLQNENKMLRTKLGALLLERELANGKFV